MGHGLAAGPRLALVVADGGPGAGLGHISRSSALALALKERGLEVRCFALGAGGRIERDGVDWTPVADPGRAPGLESAAVLVLDSYRLGDDGLDGVPEGVAIVVLQEHSTPPPRAALVVAAAADPALTRSDRLCGFAYACLRPAFWAAPARATSARIERVLVTTGGGDAIPGLGAALAASAREALPDAAVTLVRGPFGTSEAPAGVDLLDAPDSLHDSLAAADAVVSAGGQTLLEAAALGVPTIAVVAADNQRPQTARLASLGAVRLLELPADELRGVLRELDSSPDVRGELARRAQATVDGRGARRVADRVAALSSGN